MRSGFFNSELTGYDDNGVPMLDRAQDSEFFALFYRSLFTNGVFPNPSTNLQVLENTGMTVKVKPGIAFINGYFASEEVERVLNIQARNNLDRVDKVVLRMDFVTRNIDLYVVKGTPSQTPIAPNLDRPQFGYEGDIYELGIANIFVSKTADSITQERITDLRYDNDQCGVVVQCVEGIDTSTITAQLQAQVSANIALIQSALDETVAGNLQSQIDETIKVFSGTTTNPPTAVTNVWKIGDLYVQYS